MRDFIFIIGTSGIGKTTLGKGLFAHYNGAFVEQNMVPEFGIPKNVDEGIFEEQVCWECCVAQMMKFHEMGIKNIIGADFDDLRTADIPDVFKGYNYITVKLVCKDLSQLHSQMENRKNGLIDYELQRKCSDKVNKRPLLINEVEIDITNKTSQQVLDEAIRIIDNTETLIEYKYQKPKKELFYSWVFSNELR
ncbi:MAG: ATP-binding protein [Acetatifactor sp.]|nr:ATP-binding protein [Acetatifactor sp.]